MLKSLFLGIIIDTFGDLREANSELKDKVENICYICVNNNYIK